jgi:predicted nucleic acid-binding protein
MDLVLLDTDVFSFFHRWIAATAVRHGMPLLTHNTMHFRHIEGLVVITHA